MSSAITPQAGHLAALLALKAQFYGTLVPPPSSWEQLWGSCPASAWLQHPSDPRVPGSCLPLCPPAPRAAPGHGFSPLPPPGHRALPGAAREERGEPAAPRDRALGGCRCRWDPSLCKVHTPQGLDPELQSTGMLSLLPLAGV